MKQLTCEMCGSTELLKQEGVFVCQTCGTKYTVEEARKMMMESIPEVPTAVTVQAPVQVQNTAQVDNLLHLAHSSFDSKNYSQAEAFCNQVIAIDGANYEAWKLKGEAINYQITGKNDRITEVYNCIMTSYNVLDEDGQDEHREEVLDSLRVCLEGEIDFVLKLFRQDSSDSYLERVKNSFVKCASNILESYEELGYSEEEAEKYKTYIKNYFIKEVNKTVKTAWDEVVYKNYYRGGFTESYRPNNEIFRTFINEGDNLISLLKFAEKYFSSKTPATDKRENYLQQNQFQIKIRSSCSYKRMVSTTTNGYGAVTNRREYWEVDLSLTAEAKAIRSKEIDRTCELFDKMEVEIAKQDPVQRKKMLDKWTAERDSLKLGLRFGAGYIVSILIWVAGAILFWVKGPDWFSGLNLFTYIFVGVFAIGAIVCIIKAIDAATTARDVNEAEYERLDKKIKDLSK